MTQSVLRLIRKIPDTGIAIFCGVVRTENGRDEIEISETLIPPLPVKRNMYRCDKRFHTEYVADLFHIHKSYGYVVVTSDQSYIGIVEGTKHTIKYKLDTEFSTATRRGGQSASRIERLRNEQKHNYKLKVLEATIKHLQNVEGIIVAGNAEIPLEIKELLIKDTRLLVPVLGFIRVSNTVSFGDVVSQSLELIQSDDIVAEKQLVSSLEEYIRQGSDMLVFGIDNIVRCDTHNLLQYVVSSIIKDNASVGTITNTPIKTLVYSSFLDAYGGMVGVLYYPLPPCDDIEEE